MKQGTVCAVIVLAIVAGGCSEDSIEYPPGEGKVQATNALVFTPAVVLSNANHEVTFSFGSTAHSIIFDSMKYVPEDIPVSSNTSVTRKFLGQGPYTFHCGLHSGMTGKVNVWWGLD